MGHLKAHHMRRISATVCFCFSLFPTLIYPSMGRKTEQLGSENETPSSGVIIAVSFSRMSRGFVAGRRRMDVTRLFPLWQRRQQQQEMICECHLLRESKRREKSPAKRRMEVRDSDGRPSWDERDRGRDRGSSANGKEGEGGNWNQEAHLLLT